MNQNSLFYALIFLPLLLVSCISSKTLQEGEGKIQGVVTYTSGNQMPGVNKEHSSKGVQRELFLFDLLNVKDVNKEGMLYVIPNAHPILTTHSNASGEFDLFVKEGVYTLLTKEKGGFYAALFDKENNLNPVVVKKGQTTEVTILINYSANY